jgi:curved DNA-binding protein CbpA
MANSENLYDVLGVSPGADQRDIKKAYFAKVRQFPPETHPAQFALLREAYDVLGLPESRRQYDSSRGEAFAELGPEHAAQMRAAVAAMAAGDWAPAAILLQAVLSQRPDGQEARGRLCACLLSLKRHDEAEQQARELVGRYPSEPQSHLFLGSSLRGQERLDEAHQAFLEAVKCGPTSFQPVRALVDMELAHDRPKVALAFIEARLSEAVDAPMALALRMERVALLQHTLAWAIADQELDVVQVDAERLDQREELSFFLERRAAVLLAQGHHKHAEKLLRRLAALAPKRETIALTSRAVVRLSELPEASVAWLRAQRKSPEILFLPRAGVLADSLLFLLALAAIGLAALAEYHPDSDWTAPEVVLGGVLSVCAGVFAAGAGQRWWRHLNSKLGRFIAVHPLYLVEMELDEVRVWPLVALSRVAATHHHTNGMYTGTQFKLTFGSKVRSLSVRPKQLAERFGEALQAIRARLLDLLHQGVLGAENGADFVPAPLMLRGQPPRDLRRWALLASGAALGAVVAVSGMVRAQRAQEDSEWIAAQADPSPQLVRQYLERHPDGRYVRDCAELLAGRRTLVVERLRSRAPELAALLEQAPNDRPLEVSVRFSGTATAPAFRPLKSKGWLLAGLPEREIGPERRAKWERTVLLALREGLSQLAGPGWFKLELLDGAKSTSSAPLLSVAYELAFTGGAYAARSVAGDEAGATLWPAPRITARATIAGVQKQVSVEPPRSLPVVGRAAERLAADPGAAWEPLLDQLSLGFGERLGQALGAAPTSNALRPR